mmetsp:Transcript_17948/g.50611  ORF Transcript_17948/g.50611 Transcript_17948/m.50611 type:complete len:218 (-) Transcript_17948:131-784(-)
MLRKERVELNLIGKRAVARVGEQVVEGDNGEVAHPEGANDAGVNQFFHRLPRHVDRNVVVADNFALVIQRVEVTSTLICLVGRRDGPMQKVQVYISQVLLTLNCRLPYVLRPMERVIKLGRHEHLFLLHQPLFQGRSKRFSHLRLIPVRRRTVHVAVPDPNRLQNCLLGLLGRDLVCTERNVGHQFSVLFHSFSSLSLLFRLFFSVSRSMQQKKFGD